MFYYLSWSDPRAKGEIEKATKAALAPKGDCKLPCQSSGNVVQGGCCDTVYLPHISHNNIFGLPQVPSGNRERDMKCWSRVPLACRGL